MINYDPEASYFEKTIRVGDNDFIDLKTHNLFSSLRGAEWFLFDVMKRDMREYLTGKKTRKTYAQMFNVFFSWMELHQRVLSSQAVLDYRKELLSSGRSTATANLFLSAVKQLTRWIVLQQPRRAEFSEQQIASLHQIHYIRGER